jgi:fumarate hydratase, class II
MRKVNGDGRRTKTSFGNHGQYSGLSPSKDDGGSNFRKFLVEGTKPNLKKIKEYVDRSLMLVTALSPVIGYDKASKITHYALDKDLTLKQAALKLGFVTEDEFERVVDPAKMVYPYVANAS